MTMTYQEALEKARKLLSLATSDNPHESAQAAMRAQEIMSRFSIDQAALDTSSGSAVEQDEGIEDFTEGDPLDPNDGKNNFPRWRWFIAHALDATNQTKCYQHRGTLGIIGRPSDVATVRYMYAWLIKEVERLTEAKCRGNGRTYTNNFRIGVAQTVARKIEEAHKATIATMRREAERETTSTALVRVNVGIAKLEQRAKAVEDWADDNLNLRSTGRSKTNFNREAREAGKRAGESINLGAKAQLVSGRRLLSN